MARRSRRSWGGSCARSDDAGRFSSSSRDPLRSLDPDLDVAAIVAEGLDIRGGLSQPERARQVARALELVGLDGSVAARRPGELSGGQRQRVTIARAVVMEPKLLICDEPVSALDASNRNRILRLLRELRDALGVAIVIISHDLASIAGVVDRVAVLYRGRIVEESEAAELFRAPAHPYSALLLASAPGVSRSRWRFDLLPEQLQRERSDRMGDGGCVFAPRCPFALERCDEEEPERVAFGLERTVACHRAGEWRAVLARHTAP